MAQVLTVTPITPSAEPGHESYEVHWTIPHWRVVRKSESLVNQQEAVFEAASSPSAWFKTKWLVGLKVVSKVFSSRKIRLYWKLLGVTGSQSMKVEAKLETQLWNFTTGTPKSSAEKSQAVKLLGIVEESSECLQFKPDSTSADWDLISGPGEITYILKLTLKRPTTMSSSDYDRIIMEQFSKKSMQQLRQNQAALLNDSETADLIIFSSDGMEIPAHKAVMKAQCPVFAAMFNCDLSENATGIIRMTDITGKTIKILLHYFYTGILLPSWRDPDIIVEFTYAAGKYQMTGVLELLNDMLGINSGTEASNLDVELINLAGKLKLQKAEARLLKRIIDRIKKLETGGELFEFFGYDQEDTSKLAGALADEKVGEARILRLIGYFYGSNDFQDLFEKGMPLLALVRKEGLKKMEKDVLKCYVGITVHIKNADDLFKLFGRGKQLTK